MYGFEYSMKVMKVLLNNIARVFNLNHIKRNKRGLVAKEPLNYLAMVVRYVYDEREEEKGRGGGGERGREGGTREDG